MRTSPFPAPLLFTCLGATSLSQEGQATLSKSGPVNNRSSQALEWNQDALNEKENIVPQVVYVKRCVVCKQTFEVEHAAERIPEHERTDVNTACNGSLHAGEMITQKLKP